MTLYYNSAASWQSPLAASERADHFQAVPSGLQGDEWTCTVIYERTMYVCQSQPSLRALLSALQPVVTSSFHAPGANSATGHSPSLVRLRGTVCLGTSELHRQHLRLKTCKIHLFSLSYIITVSNPRVGV